MRRFLEPKSVLEKDHLHVKCVECRNQTLHEIPYFLPSLLITIPNRINVVDWN